MDEILLMALDIVKAQAGVRSMTEEEINSMLLSITRCLQQVSSGAIGAEGMPATSAFGSPEQSIAEKSVTCLECGKVFKVLTKKHLSLHDLTPEDYKNKWGLPKKVALVCKALQRERRKKMKNMKIWERRIITPAVAAKAKGKTAPTA